MAAAQLEEMIVVVRLKLYFLGIIVVFLFYEFLFPYIPSEFHVSIIGYLGVGYLVIGFLLSGFVKNDDNLRCATTVLLVFVCAGICQSLGISYLYSIFSVYPGYYSKEIIDVALKGI